MTEGIVFLRTVTGRLRSLLVEIGFQPSRAVRFTQGGPQTPITSRISPSLIAPFLGIDIGAIPEAIIVWGPFSIFSSSRGTRGVSRNAVSQPQRMYHGGLPLSPARR